MFPESLEDYGYPSSNNNNSNAPPQVAAHTRPTAVQRLVQPTHQLKSAIMNLINYQEDADVTLKAIPELLKLLGDDDKLVVAKTLKLIEQLSRKDAAKFALTTSPALLAALVHLILNTSDADLHKLSAAVLANLAANGHKPALHLIFKSGGIPALIKLLGSPVESVVFYATTTLHHLLMHEPAAKHQVCIIVDN